MIKKVTKCRVCTKNNFVKVLNFGPTPLANSFIKKENLEKGEYFFPLEVLFCKNCSFLTLGHVIDPKILFGDYVYVSSTSKVFIKHFEEFAGSVFNRFNLDSDSLVIDIGSNDGILLKPFKSLGTKVIGIEPAKHIAKVAQKQGIKTLPKYFSVKLAQDIKKKHGKSDVVTATNVFAHIDDLEEVIKGIKILLKDDGIYIIEAPYLVDFIKKKYFDLVYHEHLSYWTIASLVKLFKRHGMDVFDVERVPVHGGSVRVFVKRNTGKYKKSKNVGALLKIEESMKLMDTKTYIKFQRDVEKNKVELLSLITSLKSKNKRIVGYGAPAKGNTLLNYFGIGTELLDYIVDDSPWKQGLFSPGKRIPVVSSKKLYEDSPDYLLILAWNFSESIMEMHKEFKKRGGKFIIPVPKPYIV